MNIVKRLLNVFALFGSTLFLISFGFGVNEYLQSVKDRDEACQQKIELDKSAKNPPFKVVTEKDGREYYLYTINGKRIQADGRLTKADVEKIRADLGGEAGDLAWTEARNRCDAKLPIYEIFYNETGLWFGVVLLTMLLNYILLGKATLWNRVESPPKDQ